MQRFYISESNNQALSFPQFLTLDPSFRVTGLPPYTKLLTLDHHFVRRFAAQIKITTVFDA